ncbi:MAG: hypothetical protein WCA22_09115 [Candidatus Binatus sp.]
MKYITVIAVCIALNVTCARFAVAADQPQAGSTAGTGESAPSGDELHFVSVLTFQGEIVAVEPAKRLVTLKGPNGEVLTLEAEKEEDLAARKVGDRVLVRYFEGAQVAKEKPGEAAPVHPLKDGMIAAEPGEPTGAIAASAERVDAGNQEITLKGEDGSLETIMVSNPEHLSDVKVGDRVLITQPQGLALSVESEG